MIVKRCFTMKYKNRFYTWCLMCAFKSFFKCVFAYNLQYIA